MSKVILVLSIVLMSCSVSKQESDKYEKFIGKEIKVLLDDPEFSDYEEYVFLEEPPRKIQGVGFVYENGEFFVYIGELEHVERFNRWGKWDFEKVKKEKISRLMIYNKDNELVYDSDNK